VIVDYAVYDQGRRVPEAVELEKLYELTRQHRGFAWIGLHEPTADELDSVAREFSLHELAVEDALTAHQRPKLERYGDSFLVVLKTACITEGDEINWGEILVFVGEEFIVSVRHAEVELHDVRVRLEQRPDLLAYGPSAALWGMLDKVVDDYGPVVEALEAGTAEIEGEVFSGSRTNMAPQIYRLKREVLELSAAVYPLLDPLDRMVNAMQPLIPEQMKPYLRDVHDHLLKIAGRVHELRDSLTSVLAANLTQASFRQNEDVRKISAWAAIIAVPTLITGVYGMNFDHMPELTWKFGYPLALAVMAAVCTILYFRFRRIGWL
jgi:magnesium transporter